MSGQNDKSRGCLKVMLVVAGIVAALFAIMAIASRSAPGEPTDKTQASPPDDCRQRGAVDEDLIERLRAVDREWAEGTFLQELNVLREGTSKQCNELAAQLVEAREREFAGLDGILSTERCNDYDREAVEREIERLIEASRQQR